MKTLKRGIVFTLILTVLLTQPLQANVTRYDIYAKLLSRIDVFQGTANGFELDREPTRIEGLVMLVRLLGKENEAKALSNKPCPFSDVPTWGVGYVNYAYQNNLTSGIGQGKFGSYDKLNAKAYVTFLLRALGYDDSKGDFSYNNALDYAKSIGLIDNELYTLANGSVFLRDHVAKSSYDALKQSMNNTNQTLAEKLVADGALNEDIAESIGIIGKSIGELRVHFIDVGQALSVLIEDDYGNDILYDAGNNADDDVILDYLKKQQVDDLEYIVVSHTDEDHLGAMDAVLSEFVVENVILTDGITDTVSYKDVMKAIAAEGLNPIYVDPGDEFIVGNINMEVVGPQKNTYSEPNEYSIILMIEFGEVSFLLTGDAEILNEKELVSSGADIKANVLQVGHHGSSSSTSVEFIKAVAPDYGVISVGKGNKYGHPSDATLKTLNDNSVKVFRTDESGTIVATTDGYSITFNTTPSTFKETPSNPTPNSPVPNNPTPTNPNIPTTNVIISSLDKINELIVIKNTSTTDIDITGWKIISVTGNQTYTFPKYILKAGKSVTVASGTQQGDLKWGKANIWNNTSSDPAELYNDKGELIFRYND